MNFEFGKNFNISKSENGQKSTEHNQSSNIVENKGKKNATKVLTKPEHLQKWIEIEST